MIKKYKIKFQNILGHSDIAPNRKKDPGEKFPWRELSQENLCHWHNLSEKNIYRYRKVELNSIKEKIFLKNLYKIGYPKISKDNYNKNKNYLIKSFQRRFRQNLINGRIDKECLLISKNLLKF